MGTIQEEGGEAPSAASTFARIPSGTPARIQGRRRSWESVGAVRFSVLVLRAALVLGPLRAPDAEGALLPAKMSGTRHSSAAGNLVRLGAEHWQVSSAGGPSATLRPVMRIRTALLLGLLSFLVYNANLREVSSQDTIPARILPVALVRERTLALDMFFHDWPSGTPLPYWVQRVNGHYLSSYPLLPGLLAVPVYAMPVVLLGGDSWVLINVLAKLTASLIAALSVALVYLAATRLGPDAVAVAVALVYALGTSAWSVASQGLWGHSPAALFLAASLACLLHADERPWLLDAAGLATGLMLASRLITIFVAAALLGWALGHDRRRGMRALGWCALAAGPFLAYNLWTFGSLEGGYGRVLADLKAEGFAGTWATRPWEGLAGLLVSPSRGLFVYSPILLATMLGAGPALRNGPHRQAFAWLAGGLGVSLLVFSTYSLWFAGASFGPRLLTDFMPAGGLFPVPAWPALGGRRSPTTVGAPPVA